MLSLNSFLFILLAPLFIELPLFNFFSFVYFEIRLYPFSKLLRFLLLELISDGEPFLLEGPPLSFFKP